MWMAMERALRAVESASGSCGQDNPGPKDWWPKDCFFLKEQVFGRGTKPSELQEAIGIAET